MNGFDLIPRSPCCTHLLSASCLTAKTSLPSKSRSQAKIKRGYGNQHPACPIRINFRHKARKVTLFSLRKGEFPSLFALLTLPRDMSTMLLRHAPIDHEDSSTCTLRGTSKPPNLTSLAFIFSQVNAIQLNLILSSLAAYHTASKVRLQPNITLIKATGNKKYAGRS